MILKEIKNIYAKTIHIRTSLRIYIDDNTFDGGLIWRSDLRNIIKIKEYIEEIRMET